MGASLGGSDIDELRRSVSPAINPIQALRSPEGLAAPSGNGAFFLDANSQPQFRGRSISTSIPFISNQLQASPEDIAYMARIKKSLEAPNPLMFVPHPATVGAPAPAPIAIPNVAVPTPTPVGAGASVSPMAATPVPMLDANSLAAIQAAQAQVTNGDEQLAQMMQNNRMLALYNQ